MEVQHRPDHAAQPHGSGDLGCPTHRRPAYVYLVLPLVLALIGLCFCSRLEAQPPSGASPSGQRVSQGKLASGQHGAVKRLQLRDSRALVRQASAVEVVSQEMYAQATPLDSSSDELGTELPWAEDMVYGESYGEGCDGGCAGTYTNLGCPPCGWLLDWSRGDLWLGTTSFTGANNFLGRTASDAGQAGGSFGFQEGFNFGSRLPGILCGQLGSQLGMRFTQTQLDGSSAGDDHRTQAFITAGLFRRVDYGFQGGLVVDYLHDDWVYQADLLQLRGELSFLFSTCHDLGFRFTSSQQTDDTSAVLRGSSVPLDVRLTSIDTYRFFYRFHFGETAAGIAEMQAGFSEDSQAILGANLRMPLQNQVGLDLNATYLMPPNAADLPYTQEGWNLSMGLVWSPGRAFGKDRDYYRPLLDVGHNGNFLTKHASP